MFKYRVTNTSVKAEKTRNVFLTEVGKLLKPGESCCTNRVDGGTRSLEKNGILKVEEGAFEDVPSSGSAEEAAKVVAAKDAKKAWSDEKADGAKQAAEVKAAADKAAAEKAAADKAAADKAAAEKAAADKAAAEKAAADKAAAEKKSGDKKSSKRSKKSGE